MIPLKQRYGHHPERGIYGDCHRAAMASLLELPLDDVPHFCDESLYAPDAKPLSDREREWLLSRGLTSINIIFPGETPLDDVLGTMNGINPGVLFILGGTSVNGCGHSVVAGNGRVVHDPSIGAPSNKHGSIIGPMEDGYWWLTFIGAAITVDSKEMGPC